MPGGTSPGHLLSSRARKISSTASPTGTPTTNKSKTTVLINVLSILYSSFRIFRYSVIRIFAVSKSSFSFTASRLISAT